MFHRRFFVVPEIKTVRGRLQKSGRPRTGDGNRRRKLFLPGALLVTVQAQLFTTFVFVDLGLAAFFD
jgi:hypothetical protein